ncbi:hypothetical protein [Citrobacter farmeri]
MADWFIATEGVKVVKDSASLWPQIITAVSSAGAALGGVYLAHYFTRRREERAAAVKLVSERLFIATELVFLLEQFAEGCTRLATDSGEQNPEGEYTPTENLPELIITNISGDWRTLPPGLCTVFMNSLYSRMKSGGMLRLSMSITGNRPTTPDTFGNVSFSTPDWD